MAAEWWLIDKRTQAAIADKIDEASSLVIAHFDLHGNENSLTAALGERLLTSRVRAGGTDVTFSYRNFLEQREEHETGADGGFIVTVRSAKETVKKAVLFQAKRFAQQRPIKSLALPRSEVERLRIQLDSMIALTEECIVLAYTRQHLYSIDGTCAEQLSIEKLRHITRHCRLITLGTFLGKWVARCTRGDIDSNVVARVEEPKGFLKHVIGMDVNTDQTPLLTEGERQVDPAQYKGIIPQPRWQS